MVSHVALPNEVWLEAMTYLDYFDLKCCIRVSKTFQALVQNAALDRELFRSRLITRADEHINLSKVRTHPGFDRVSFECLTDINDVSMRCWNNYNDDTCVTECSAAAEYATFPTVDHLRFKFRSWKMVDVKDKDGVTFVQVMEALCCFFAKPEGEGCIRRDAMGDHTGWTGWDEVKLDRKKRIILRVDCFDS